jgi:hypothetical protein
MGPVRDVSKLDGFEDPRKPSQLVLAYCWFVRLAAGAVAEPAPFCRMARWGPLSPPITSIHILNTCPYSSAAWSTIMPLHSTAIESMRHSMWRGAAAKPVVVVVDMLKCIAKDWRSTSALAGRETTITSLGPAVCSD